MKKSILPAVPILCLIIMLLFPALSFTGAKNGLLLWFNVVLPTLMPFMLCSALIVAWGGVDTLTGPFAPLLAHLGLSRNGCYAFLTGILCGYPMGAKTTADFICMGKLNLQEGKRLLAIAAFPSPMFLAGYIRSLLPAGIPFAQAAAALYLPIPILALLSAWAYKTQNVPPQPDSRTARRSPLHRAAEPNPPGAETIPSFEDSFMNVLETMVKIGGYIMFFSILLLFVNRLLPERFLFGSVLLGFIEMTTGIEEISRRLEGAGAAAAILASAAFGGLSGAAQTAAVIKNAGLSIRHYVFWKLLHAALTSLFFILLSGK